MNTPPPISIAIQQLYEAFSRYSLHENMQGCPCCIHRHDHERIRNISLHLLSEDDVTKYAYKAMTTWGNVDDFKYLLPRLFELQMRTPFIDTEILFSKLHYAQWNQWPAHEQQVIRQFFVSYWYTVLQTVCEEPTTASDEVLCGIAQAEDDLRVYLELWVRPYSLQSLSHLYMYIQWNWDKLIQHTLGNAFWQSRSHQQQQVVTWLINTDLVDYLEVALVQTNTQATATILSKVIETIRQLRSVLTAAG